MKKLLTAIIVIGLTACNQPAPKGGAKKLDFGSFTIETPQAWKAVEEKGVDSHVGRIAIDSTDTLSFDLGWYSNPLTEDGPYILNRSEFEGQEPPVDQPEVIVVEDKTKVDADEYRKQNALWDTIGRHRAKIVSTRKPGIGITGVYIDSLWVRGSNRDRFNLYGENLKPENEKEVLQAIRTLKFYKN